MFSVASETSPMFAFGSGRMNRTEPHVYLSRYREGDEERNDNRTPSRKKRATCTIRSLLSSII